MKVTNNTRRALASRRQQRNLMSLGYSLVFAPVWELDRGFRTHERIVDVQIAANGIDIYVKTGPRIHTDA